MKPDAILDNTVFNISARIHTCDLISLADNLFNNILIPQAIASEIQSFPKGYELEAEQKMEYYFSRIRLGSKGLQLCTTYDSVVLSFIKDQQNVDNGEAEAIAQAQKRYIGLFFTDDDKCIRTLSPLYPNIRFVPTLYLIALLDVLGYLPNYDEVIREYFTYKPLPLQSKARKNEKEKFRSAYKNAVLHFNLSISKKDISKKTSLKRLGL